MDKLKVIAINGSPRKNFSTAKLLSSFTEGAKAAGQNIEVKQINLYDYNYSGCRECYLCKAGSSVHGILQARVLKWVAISFSRGSSLPRDRTQVSHIVDRGFTI